MVFFHPFVFYCTVYQMWLKYFGICNQTLSASLSMNKRSNTHSLRMTMTNSLQLRSLHQSGQTRVPLLSSLLGELELLFQSRDQLQRYWFTHKSSFTERPVNQGGGFSQWPTSHHSQDVYQNQRTKYVWCTPEQSAAAVHSSVIQPLATSQTFGSQSQGFCHILISQARDVSQLQRICQKFKWKKAINPNYSSFFVFQLNFKQKNKC